MSATEHLEGSAESAVPDLETEVKRPLMRNAFLYFTCALAFAGGGIATLAYARDFMAPPSKSVAELLKARLPKTKVTSVNCDKVDGLCEVTAGSNLFYIDRTARYLVIGRVYDMETRQDLTATRLLEMNPDMLLGGSAKANAAGADDSEPALAARPAAAAKAAAAPVQKLPLGELPKEGAIVWGNSSGKTVTVFSDFRCSYCRALSNTLASMNVRVVERPISVLGSRDIADKVYCAKDKAKALHAAYSGQDIKGTGPCNTSGLDANEAFAHKHGLSGTPVIVRGDGSVLEGYRPKEFLENWLKGGQS